MSDPREQPEGRGEPYFAWWRAPVGDEERIWVRHVCLDGQPDDYPLPMHDGGWRDAGTPEPSFHCEVCGRHTILNETDRIDPPTPGSSA